MNRLHLVWTLARKDWHLFLADRRAAVLSFVVPIVLASAFGLIFHRPSERMGVVRLPLLVVDEDHSPLSRHVIDDLRQSEQVDLQQVDRSTAEARIADRSCGVAVVLPRGFGQMTWTHTLTPQGRPHVELLHHPLSAMESQWAEGVLTEIVLRRMARDQANVLPGTSVPMHLDRPFRLARILCPQDSQQRFNAYSHSFSGMTLQYLLFWGMESGLLFLRERHCGIWRRFLAAPVPIWTMLAGRALATAWIAVLQVLTTFAFGHLVFGVRVDGSWLGFLMLVSAVGLLAAAIGLLVATLGGTEARARNVCILAILAISLLGGLWLPMFLLPRWVQELSLSLPTTWAMRGLDCATWEGGSLAQMLPSVLMVFVFAGLFLSAALARFLWMEARQRRGWTS